MQRGYRNTCETAAPHGKRKKELTNGPPQLAALMGHNGEVRGASRLAGEASSAEGATSTVVLGTNSEADV